VGKSTLLHVLGGLDRFDSGRIRMGDADLGAMTDHDVVAFRNRHIGFVFQFHHLLPEFDAVENTEMPLRIARESVATARPRAEELLRRVGLGDRLDHRPGTLSGGEQQRVAISRALVTDPLILLADEPTGNLDTRNGLEVLAIFQRLHREGRTLVMITHDHAVAEHARRLIVLKDGRVVDDRPVDQPRDAETELRVTQDRSGAGPG